MTMNAWTCALLIIVAGSLGGVVNSLIRDQGFTKPQKKRDIWCPGTLADIVIGALAAFGSWALYGSGAGIDLAQSTQRAEISLRFSALAGAFFVGVAGSKWIAGEVGQRLLKESVKVAGAKKNLTSQECEELVKGSPLQVLERVEAA